MTGKVVVLSSRREAAVRLKARLEELAADHPELIGNDSSAADWEAILVKTKAGAAQVVSFRLDAELLGRLDRLVAKMQTAAPWAKGIGRTDAVRKLLIEGLDREGVTSTPAPPSHQADGAPTTPRASTKRKRRK